ncbi:hypothetical protein V1478_000173 [Vespula squamosa]|uniref:Uncharacterized protein n=1 Tax=Vespula squamosa TaxID=30214 RepID=A0ABD2C8W1_VESSQ
MTSLPSASSSNKSFLAGLPVEGGRSVDADEKRGKNEENKWSRTKFRESEKESEGKTRRIRQIRDIALRGRPAGSKNKTKENTIEAMMREDKGEKKIKEWTVATEEMKREMVLELKEELSRF